METVLKNEHTESEWAALALLRFFLAMVVVLGHYALCFRSDSLHLFGGGYLNPLSSVFGFFILSGYSIAASLERSAAGFYKRRFVRIWPIYLAGIAYGLAIYYLLIPHGFTWPLGQDMPLRTTSIIVSLLMMQGILAEPIPIVGAIWSLSPEWWLYTLAPYFRKMTVWVLGFLSVASFAFFIAAHHLNLNMLAVEGWSDAGSGRAFAGLAWMWIIGFVYHRYRGTTFGFVMLLAPALLAASIGRSPGMPYFIAAFALILCHPIRLPEEAIKACDFLGDLSYPIYLFHFPTMAALASLGVVNRVPVVIGVLAASLAALYLVDYPARAFFARRRPRMTTIPPSPV